MLSAPPCSKMTCTCWRSSCVSSSRGRIGPLMWGEGAVGMPAPPDLRKGRKLEVGGKAPCPSWGLGLG